MDQNRSKSLIFPKDPFIPYHILGKLLTIWIPSDDSDVFFFFYDLYLLIFFLMCFSIEGGWGSRPKTYSMWLQIYKNLQNASPPKILLPHPDSSPSPKKELAFVGIPKASFQAMYLPHGWSTYSPLTYPPPEIWA